MAIYHVSGQVISRSAGRSAVAAAAYRSAERLFDEREGIFHDYQKKAEDILHKEIIKPDNAPGWVTDREKLWNTVEKTEVRKDAQLAREFNISLPRELSLEQNIELVREYVQKEFVDRGMIADVCMHEGKSHGGERQPHVHVMLTMREINEEGFGKKVREWNNKELLLKFREAWANTANLHLAKAGFDMLIDHRTLEAQGIDLQPQNKIGPKEGRERYDQNIAEHQEIARSNGEKLYAEPEIALYAITSQQSTFSHHDMARFVNRHTVDNDQFTRVYEKVKSSPELIRLGVDDRGLERYSTKDMVTIEYGLAVMAKEQAQEERHQVSHGTQDAILKGYNLSEEQKGAFNHVLAKDLACVVGFAGTGKSYMLKAAREAWEKEGYNVHGMTLSGIAAENLEDSSGIKSNTIASRILSWNNNSRRLNSSDIVVIDEAGLVGSRDMFTIMNEVNNAKAKLVLIGDPEQLQPIQAGAAFRMIAQQCDYVQVNDIRRQEIGWQRQATFCLATGRTEEALDMYQKHGDVEVFETREKAMLAMVNGWKNELIWDENRSQIMMAYTRKDVERLNLEARKIMENRGIIKESLEMQTDRGKRMFAENERIYFLRNNKDLGVKNGTLGTIQKIWDNENMLVKTDKGSLVNFSLGKYNHLEYGYATTVYKAQGVTVDKAHVLASPNYNRHATYVAMSRHKEEVKLYWAKEDFSSFNSLKNRMGKAGNKEVSLDYMDAAIKYAGNRDIDAEFGGLAKSLQENVIKPTELANSIDARVAARSQERMYNRDMASLEEKMGKNISFEFEHGDKGRYRGITKVADKSYGVIEQKNEVKLVQAKLCEGLEHNAVVMIKKTDLKTVEAKVEIEQISQERSKTLDFSIGR